MLVWPQFNSQGEYLHHKFILDAFLKVIAGLLILAGAVLALSLSGRFIQSLFFAFHAIVQCRRNALI